MQTESHKHSYWFSTRFTLSVFHLVPSCTETKPKSFFPMELYGRSGYRAGPKPGEWAPAPGPESGLEGAFVSPAFEFHFFVVEFRVLAMQSVWVIVWPCFVAVEFRVLVMQRVWANVLLCLFDNCLCVQSLCGGWSCGTGISCTRSASACPTVRSTCGLGCADTVLSAGITTPAIAARWALNYHDFT